MAKSILRLKLEALAQHEDCQISDIEPHTDERFDVLGTDSEYLVLTEEEAQKRVGEEILSGMWAFSPQFIRQHTGLPQEAEEMIKGFCETKCEDANPVIFAMVKDTERFIHDAIAAGGRGLFLSPYNGTENEETVDGVTLYIYRIN